MAEKERKDETAQEAAAIEVTAEMVEAGFRVLAASGIADDYLEADRLLVERIYRAMSALRPGPIRPPRSG